jgi:hypothetical protein
MATYTTKQMRDGRIQLYKPYQNGIKVSNYPLIGGGWSPHISYPGRLNDSQKALCNSLGLKHSFHWGRNTEIRFSKEVLDSRQMLVDMELLGPIASLLNKLK